MNILAKLRSLLPLILAGGALAAEPAWIAELPMGARIAILIGCAVASVVWRLLDADRDGRVSLDEAAAILGRRDRARSPWWVGVAALALLFLSACGAAPTVYVQTDGAAWVAAGVEGLPPIEVDADGRALVRWQVGAGSATVEAGDGVCATVRWGLLELARTCATIDPSE